MSDERRFRWLIGALAGTLAVRAFVRARRRFELRGKVVIVTGGARGLGLVLARELARRGAKLVLAARDTATLTKAHRELEGRGAAVLAVRCDVRDRGSVEQMVAAARSTFGRVDALVNVAGVIEVGPLETMTEEDFTRSMDTHFLGPLHTMSAVVESMRAQGGGRIVNIASIGGLVPVPHIAPYGASKAALVGLSGAFGAELARSGIIVTTVCPGLMRTGSPGNARFSGQPRAEYLWFALLDALPPFSMRAERAARRIVTALERGERYLVIGAGYRAVALLQAVFPNLFARAVALAARALPGPGEGRSALGYETGPDVSPRAARRNNEQAWAPRG